MARNFERLDNNPHSKEFYFEGGSIGVLLVHGFTGTPGTMKKIGEALKDDGYTVSGIRLPGHGTSVEDMENSNWKQWLEAARKGADDLSRKCDKMIICGLSMGGLLTTILASELEPQGAILLASAIKLKGKSARLASLLKFLIRYRVYDNTNKDIHPYAISYNATPLRKVTDFFKLQKMAKKSLNKISCPLLIVQGKLDKSVSDDAPEIIYNGTINVNDKKIVYLENSKHVCTLEPEFDILIKEIREFIIKCT